MKEITSIATRKVQIVTEETWNDIVKRNWASRFSVREIPERKFIQVPKILPTEIKTKTKKNG